MRVHFRVIRNKKYGVCHGWCSVGNYIAINLMTNGHVGNTYLHEKLHWEHPDWSETKVRRETAKRWRAMNMRQRFNLYKELFNRKFRP